MVEGVQTEGRPAHHPVGAGQRRVVHADRVVEVHLVRARVRVRVRVRVGVGVGVGIRVRVKVRVRVRVRERVRVKGRVGVRGCVVEVHRRERGEGDERPGALRAPRLCLRDVVKRAGLVLVHTHLVGGLG